MAAAAGAERLASLCTPDDILREQFLFRLRFFLGKRLWNMARYFSQANLTANGAANPHRKNATSIYG